MCKKKENIRQIHKIMIPNNQPGEGGGRQWALKILIFYENKQFYAFAE